MAGLITVVLGVATPAYAQEAVAVSTDAGRVALNQGGQAAGESRSSIALLQEQGDDALGDDLDDVDSDGEDDFDDEAYDDTDDDADDTDETDDGEDGADDEDYDDEGYDDDGDEDTDDGDEDSDEDTDGGDEADDDDYDDDDYDDDDYDDEDYDDEDYDNEDYDNEDYDDEDYDDEDWEEGYGETSGSDIAYVTDDGTDKAPAAVPGSVSVTATPSVASPAATNGDLGPASGYAGTQNSYGKGSGAELPATADRSSGLYAMVFALTGGLFAVLGLGLPKREGYER